MQFQKKGPGAASWALAGKAKGSNMHMRAQAPLPAPHVASFQARTPNSPSHAHTRHPLSRSGTSPIDWNPFQRCHRRRGSAMPGLPTPPFAHAQRPVLVHAAQRVLVSPACSTLSTTLPTFTPWRSLLGSAGGTTASLVLTMGTMFIRSSSCSVPLRFRRFCSSWKSKLVTKI